MNEAYSALGLIAIAINLLAGTIGGVSWMRERPSTPFWYLLRVAQVATMIFVLFASVTYGLGHRATDQLHYLYIFLPVVVSFLAELMRGGAAGQELGERFDPEPGEGAQPLAPDELAQRFAELGPEQQHAIGLAIVRRESGIMTVSCLVIAFLLWRALVTTAGLF